MRVQVPEHQVGNAQIRLARCLAALHGVCTVAAKLGFVTSVALIQVKCVQVREFARRPYILRFRPVLR